MYIYLFVMKISFFTTIFVRLEQVKYNHSKLFKKIKHYEKDYSLCDYNSFNRKLYLHAGCPE